MTQTPSDQTVPVRVPILEAEPWLAHRPAECVNAFCKPKQWCIGCDPEGTEDCVENPWPCAAVIENDPAYAAGVAAGRAQAAADIRADVETVLTQHVMHSHERPGIWDACNPPEIANKPCVECAARKRLYAWLTSGISHTECLDKENTDG